MKKICFLLWALCWACIWTGNAFAELKKPLLTHEVTQVMNAPLSLDSEGAVASIVSPNNLVKGEVLKIGAIWHLIASCKEEQVADITLGINLQDRPFSTQLTFDEVTLPVSVLKDYAVVHGKHSQNYNEGNSITLSFKNITNALLKIEICAFNDGLAFRYIIPEEDTIQRQFLEEVTSYKLPTDANRWLMNYVTSYEADFPLQKGEERQGAWGYPALFQVGDVWALITEAGIDGTYCGTHLDNSSIASCYRVSYPYSWEGNNTGEANPKGTTPWASPWRVVIMGSLGTIVESTMVQDVSPASKVKDTSWIEPGSSSWVYWAYNHEQRIINFVANM